METLSNETWEPEKYHDTLLELIRRKEEGQKIVASPRTEGAGEVLDLVEALKKSLERGAAKKKEPAKVERKEPRRKRKAG